MLMWLQVKHIMNSKILEQWVSHCSGHQNLPECLLINTDIVPCSQFWEGPQNVHCNNMPYSSGHDHVRWWLSNLATSGKLGTSIPSLYPTPCSPLSRPDRSDEDVRFYSKYNTLYQLSLLLDLKQITDEILTIEQDSFIWIMNNLYETDTVFIISFITNEGDLKG